MARPAGVRLGEHADGRADLSGGAVAALQRVLLDERLLHQVQFVVGGQAFDGGDLPPLDRDGEHQAGVHPPAVDQHGAGATLAVVAALLAAGQPQVIAQGVQQ